MERKIIIRDYADARTEINIENFEKVLKIDCGVTIGDEALIVLYDDLTVEVFNSSDYSIMDFEDGYYNIYKDGYYNIYKKDKLDLIDKFNTRKSSYDEIGE